MGPAVQAANISSRTHGAVTRMTRDAAPPANPAWLTVARGYAVTAAQNIENHLKAVAPPVQK